MSLVFFATVVFIEKHRVFCKPGKVQKIGFLEPQANILFTTPATRVSECETALFDCNHLFIFSPLRTRNLGTLLSDIVFLKANLLGSSNA
jgi:hypothetical protein